MLAKNGVLGKGKSQVGIGGFEGHGRHEKKTVLVPKDDVDLFELEDFSCCA